VGERAENQNPERSGSLCEFRPLNVRLRNEAAEWDVGEDIPPLLLEAAEAVESLAAKVAMQTEGLRWIAAGKTGSYGTPQAFACAILEDE
jgi:hypothetical protein